MRSGLQKKKELMVWKGSEDAWSAAYSNECKGIYLEDGTLVGHLLPAIDSRLGQAQKLNRRLSL